MTSAPDRGKECLPPKKREFQASRQSSSEQHPKDDFKQPPPYRNRTGGKLTDSKEPAKGPLLASHYSKDLLPPPPPPPPKFIPPDWTLQWPISFFSQQQDRYSSSQVGDKLSSSSPTWREQCARSVDPADSNLNHLRWKHKPGQVMLHQTRGPSSYHSSFVASTKDNWGCLNLGKQTLGPSVLSPGPHFSQQSAYPRDRIHDNRKYFAAKEVNGLDGRDSRHEHIRRSMQSQESDYHSKTEFTVSHGGYTNGKRRHLGDQKCLAVVSAKDSQPLEVPKAHSPQQDKDSCITVNTLSAAATEKRRVNHEERNASSSMNSMGRAQIYYAVPSLYPAALQAPIAYPIYSHPGQVMAFGLETEAAQKMVISGLSPLDRNVEMMRRGRSLSHSLDHSSGAPIDYSCSSPAGSRSQSSATATSKPSPTSSPAPLSPLVLTHFTKGSLIQLSTGELKNVEDLQTDDFLRSAAVSPEFHLSFCTIQHISPSPSQGCAHLQVLLGDQKVQELLKVLVEYPFFVRNQGWSSCCPQRTLQLYGLSCHQLMVGDVCLVLTPAPTPSPVPSTDHQGQTSGKNFVVPPSRQTDTAPQTSTGAVERTSRSGNMPPSSSTLRLTTEDTVTSDKRQQSRKRRWSAPEFVGAHRTPVDLPHSPKHGKQQ
nr:PREDICTED: uncharacterized protein LOC102691565 [Lepisosteus oculatus]XP_015220403.1 PREDICTED: uncharacterized protein LOC102691565 [Lepisosteus oculatus]